MQAQVLLFQDKEINSPYKNSVIQSAPTHNLNSCDSLENILQNIFPQKAEENTIIRTRKLLGITAETLPNEQISFIVTEFQFLIEGWLDEFEKEVFNGKTLKEILNENPYAGTTK